MGGQLESSISDLLYEQDQFAAARTRASQTAQWVQNANTLSTDWYWETDARNLITTVQGGSAIAAGRASEAYIGNPFWDLGSTNLQKADWEAHRRQLNSGEAFTNLQLQFHDAQGAPYWLSISGRPIHGVNHRVNGYSGIAKDITDWKLAEERADRMAFTDRLTGLPNRPFLLSRLPIALSNARRTQQQVLLCCLNINDFSHVNAESGQIAGDQVLQELARRLPDTVRESDTIVRMESDQFGILFENLPGDSTTAGASTQAVVSKVLTALEQPYTGGHKGTPIQCRIRIGSVLSGAGAQSAGDMLTQAHQALQAAKASGTSHHPWTPTTLSV